MNFYEKVLLLIENAGISRNKLLTAAEINHNAFQKWKNPDTIPSGETVAKVARYFNVSTDYLLGLTADPSPRQNDLAPDELTLLERYRSMSGQGQELAQQMLYSLADTHKKIVVSAAKLANAQVV